MTEPQKPVAFIIMPFKDELSWVFEHIIEPALTEAEYEVIRADSGLDQRAIIQDIVTGIIGATLVVADLTGSNPNVMYELGISHSLGTPTFLMTQTLPDTPFDVKAYRANFYSKEPASVSQIKKTLTEVAKARLGGSIRFSNPVADFVPKVRTVLEANYNQPFGAFRATTFYSHPDMELRSISESAELPVDHQRFMADLNAALDRVNAWNEEMGECSSNEAGQATSLISKYAEAKMTEGGAYNRVRIEKAAASTLAAWAERIRKANELLKEGASGLQNTADDLASSIFTDKDKSTEWIEALRATQDGAGKLHILSSQISDARDRLLGPSNAGPVIREQIRVVAAEHGIAANLLGDLAAYSDRLSSIIEERLDGF